MTESPATGQESHQELVNGGGYGSFSKQLSVGYPVEELRSMIERTHKFSARQDGVVVEDLAGELLIYDRSTDVAHCLSEVAAVAWRSCEGRATVAEIADQIVANGLASSHDEAIVLADAAVAELGEKGLLEEATGFTSERVPRRQALRRIAGVGMAAATGPLVFSAAVPNAFASASHPTIYYGKTFDGTVYYFQIVPNFSNSTYTCSPVASGTLPTAGCRSSSYGTYHDCSDVSVTVNSPASGKVTVSSTLGGEVPDPTQSWIACGSNNYLPSQSSTTGGSNGNGYLVFTCGTGHGGTC